MSDLLNPDEVAFHLPLTAPEMKVTHAALKAFLNDFGHDEHEIQAVVRRVLDKLPDEGSIRSISI
jgi:hypothetical protein